MWFSRIWTNLNVSVVYQPLQWNVMCVVIHCHYFFFTPKDLKRREKNSDVGYYYYFLHERVMKLHKLKWRETEFSFSFFTSLRKHLDSPKTLRERIANRISTPCVQRNPVPQDICSLSVLNDSSFVNDTKERKT